MTQVQRLQVGDTTRPFTLPSIEGRPFELTSLLGRRHMLSFMRFASCPFCNLRIHQLVEAFGRFSPDFTIVAVFDSPLENLVQHARRHESPFPILADEAGRIHRGYAIEQSVAGTVKGVFLRAPTLAKAMAMGYLPTASPQGSMTAMPADFLVDETGTVCRAHYGRDEGDHIPLQDVIAFSNGPSATRGPSPAAVGD